MTKFITNDLINNNQLMITFANYAKKQCECSNNLIQFICTKAKCKKNSLVCNDCFFDEPHDHLNFCIPISRYKMQELTPKFYETIKTYIQTLNTIKEQVITLLQDEIDFVNKINNLDEETVFKLNFLPKFNSPPANLKEYILNNFSSEFVITTKLRKNIKNIQNKLNNTFNQMFSLLNNRELEIKISPSILDNKPLFDNIGNDHTLQFSINTQKQLTLTGIGYNSKVFKEIQNATFSLYVNSNVIFQNETYLNLTNSKLINSNQSGVDLIRLNPIVIGNKNLNNMITLEIKPETKNITNTKTKQIDVNLNNNNPFSFKSQNLFDQPKNSLFSSNSKQIETSINQNLGCNTSIFGTFHINSNKTSTDQDKHTNIYIDYVFPEFFVFDNLEMNSVQCYSKSKPFVTQLFFSEISDEVE